MQYSYTHSLSPDRLLPVGCVARHHKIPPRTLRRWITQGWLPAQRVGLRSWGIRAADLERFLLRRTS
jgi:excisionase family DNA binding protein